MNKYWEHFKTITRHKYFVMIECFKLGIYWQGIIHDLSKYSIIEFSESAKYFHGTGTPINKIKQEIGYSRAWLHHKGINKHHWEYWTDFFDGEIKPCPIPKKYIKEMYCDMIGASKAYLKQKYDKNEPLNYFLKRKDKFLMVKEDKEYLEKLLRNH